MCEKGKELAIICSCIADVLYTLENYVYVTELVKWFSGGWINEASFLAMMDVFLYYHVQTTCGFHVSSGNWRLFSWG